MKRPTKNDPRWIPIADDEYRDFTAGEWVLSKSGRIGLVGDLNEAEGVCSCCCFDYDGLIAYIPSEIEDDTNDPN